MRRRTVLYAGLAIACRFGRDVRRRPVAACRSPGGGLDRLPTSTACTTKSCCRSIMRPPAGIPSCCICTNSTWGVTGKGLMKQVNGWFNTPAFRSRHPCIVVMPMLDQTNDKGGKLINFGGKSEGHVGEDNAIAALKQVIARYSVDTRQDLCHRKLDGRHGHVADVAGLQRPDREQGAVSSQPDCRLPGRSGPLIRLKRRKALRQVPIWAIHGAQDKEVRPGLGPQHGAVDGEERNVSLYRSGQWRAQYLGHLLHASDRLGLVVLARRQGLIRLVELDGDRQRAEAASRSRVKSMTDQPAPIAVRCRICSRLRR